MEIDVLSDIDIHDICHKNRVLEIDTWVRNRVLEIDAWVRNRRRSDTA